MKAIRLPDSAVEYVHDTVDFWNDLHARRGEEYPVLLDDAWLPPPKPENGGGGPSAEVPADPDTPGDCDGAARPGTVRPSGDRDEGPAPNIVR